VAKEAEPSYFNNTGNWWAAGSQRDRRLQAVIYDNAVIVTENHLRFVT